MKQPYTTVNQLTPALQKLVEQHATKKSYQAGDAILSKGSNIGSAIIIGEGVVKVFREDDNGCSHFLYFLGEGELCVLSALCCMRIRQADMRAIAATSCEIYYIASPYPERWMQEYPEWSQYVMISFNKRMSELLETFDSVVFGHLDSRLQFYLRHHYRTLGDVLNMSHQQIADELNTSREVISRQLKKLEEGGFVEINRTFLKISPSINE